MEYKLVLLLLMLCSSRSFILPDRTNPVIKTGNTVNFSGESLTFKFSLSDSPGLPYKGFIGVDFSASSAFTTFSAATFSCSLADSEGEAFTVTSVSSTSPIGYCQLTDTDPAKKLVTDKIYHLTLTFASTFPSNTTQYFQYLSLFTTVSPSAPMKLDVNRIFCTFKLYPSFLSISSNPTEITSSSLSKSTIEINSTFETSHHFLIKSYISNEHTFVVEYDSDYFNPPTEVSSEDGDLRASENLKKKLSGSLFIEKIKDGMISIGGMNEQLMPERTFKVLLKGWTAKRKYISASPLKFYFFYKNSNTVFAVSEVLGLMKIDRAALEEPSINNVEEYSYVASGMSWPLIVSFKPNVDLENTHFVLSTTSSATTEVKFNASTCDFSSATKPSNFGESPICFPFNVENTNTENGVHFYIKDKIMANKTFTFKIWAHFSKCGADTNTARGVTFDSTLIAYNKIDSSPNKRGFPTDVDKIAESSIFSSSIKCLQSTMVDSTDRADNFPTLTNAEDNTNIYLLARELNELSLFNIYPGVNPDVLNIAAYKTDGTTAHAYYVINTTEGVALTFKLGETASLVYLKDNSTFTNENYLTVVAKSYKVGKALSFWPSTYSAKNTAYLDPTTNYLEILFNKKWFTRGIFSENLTGVSKMGETCLTTWKLFADAGTDTVFNFSYQVNNDALTTAELLWGNMKAFDPSTQNITFLFQGDNTNLADTQRLPSQNDEHPHYFIRAKPFEANNIYRFPVADPSNNTTDYTYFAFFTNCIKLKASVTATTIFDYFEIIFTIRNSLPGNQGVYSRMLRLISFNSMFGVFSSNPSDTTFTTEMESKVFSAVGSFASNQQHLCMTVLGLDVVRQGRIQSKNFVLFLLNVDLFETDFSSYDNRYPIGNLHPGIRAFGFNTRLPLFESDFRLDKQEFLATKFMDNSTSRLYQFSDMTTLSSQIWFTNVIDNEISMDDSNNLTKSYIPHYCTEGFSTNKNFAPALSFAWFDGDNYTNIKFAAKTYKDTSLYYLLTSVTDFAKPANFNNHHVQMWAAHGYSNLKVTAAKAVPYTGVTATTLSSMDCMSVLLTDEANFSASHRAELKGLGFSSRQDSKTDFYFLGHEYSRVFLYEVGTSSDVLTSINGTISGLDIILENLMRPTLDDVVDSAATIKINDSLVIGGVGTGNANRMSYDNLFSETYLTVERQVALVNLDKYVSAWTVTYAGINESFYTNDSRIKADLLNTVELPKYSPVVVSMDSANSAEAICSVYNDTSMAVSCTKAGSDFTCPLPENTKQVSLCCFNVKLNSNKFALAKISLGYTKPVDVPGLSPEYTMFDDVLTAESTFDNVSVYSEPKVSSVLFDLSTTEGSLSRAVIEVNLGKQLNPGMTIEVGGNFSEMSWIGQTPNCSVQVDRAGKRWDRGDEVLVGCSISNFGSSDGKFTVTTKNEAIRCNSSYSTKIYILVWPVKVKNMSNIELKTRILLGSNELTSGTFSDQTSSSTSETVKYIDQTDAVATLCNITSIYPKIAGIAATYTIKLNQTEVPSTSKANELIIFLPFSIQPDEPVYCQDEAGLDLDCAGHMNIFRINFKFPVSGDKTISINNIKNKITAENSLFVECQLNNLTGTGERTAIAVGRGTYTGALSAPASVHSLIFHSPSQNVGQAQNPRTYTNTNTYFEFSYDTASSHNLADITVGSNPKLYIEFPSSYPLAKYPSQVQVDFKFFERDLSSNEFLLKPEQSIVSGPAEVHGRTISISLNKEEFVFKASIVYFSVNLKNIVFPEDEIEDAGIINVFITNSDQSVMFRSYDNTNNRYFSKIDATSNKLVNYFRGSAYKFDKTNWVVDFFNKGSDIKNRIFIRTGFYSDIVIDSRYFENLDTKSSQGKITFQTQGLSLKMRQNGKQVDNLEYSTFFSQLEVEMGVSCGTALGNYLATVNVQLDSPEPKIITWNKVIISVELTEENIMCNYPSEPVPKNSRVAFTCSFSPVVDSFKVIYANKDKQDNKSKAEVSTQTGENAVTGIFSTSFSEELPEVDRIAMEVSTTNKCLKFKGKDTEAVTFGLTEAPQPAFSDADLETIYYTNSSDDSSIMEDQLQFQVTIPKYTAVFCTVVCSHNDFPDADKIKSLPQNEEDQYFFSIYSEDYSKLHKIRVNKVKKNQDYKVKCILAAADQRMNKTVEKEFLTMPKGVLKTAAKISLTSKLDTKCAQFIFDSEIEEAAKQKIVNFCQNILSEEAKKGCMVCTDLEEKIFAAGAAITASKCQKRQLQETTTEKTVYFEACAYQNVICPTQLSQSEFDFYFNKFKDSLNSTEKIAKMGINLSGNSDGVVKLKAQKTIIDSPLIKMVKCDDGRSESHCIIGVSNDIKFTGEYTVKVKLNVAMKCYYAIKLRQASSPTIAQLKECDGKLCGTFYSEAEVDTDLTHTGTPERFKRGESYSLYVGCEYNKVVRPEYSLESSVEVVSKDFPILTKECPVEDIDPDIEKCWCLNGEGTKIEQGEDGKECSSVFFKVGVALLVVLLFL